MFLVRCPVPYLDGGFGVFFLHALVAGKRQDRRAGGLGVGQARNQVGKARTFGAGGGGDFAGHARKGVGGVHHGTLVAAGIDGMPILAIACVTV